MTPKPAVADAACAGRSAGAGRPWWRRGAVWLVIVVVVLGGIALAAVAGGSTSATLDPASTAGSGSRALARVLAGYGTTVTSTRSVDDAAASTSGVLLVIDPDAYSDAQLRTLVASARQVVLLAPGNRALSAVSSIEPDDARDPSSSPGCTLPAAGAAGSVDLPDDASSYTGPGTTCYGGVVAVAGRVVVLGSTDMLRNDHLADRGVAALDVNLLSADRTAASLVWLRPGSDAAGSGSASIWDVFPDSAHRAFVWLIVVGLLVVLWRARRLGAPVPEPLPVIVRSAELVEGHGRLYRRAGAIDRAAAALRAATARRLTVRLGLPRGASPEQISAAAAPVLGRDPVSIHTVLAGGVPGDDTELIRLAADLDELDATARGERDAPPADWTHPTERTAAL